MMNNLDFSEISTTINSAVTVVDIDCRTFQEVEHSKTEKTDESRRKDTAKPIENGDIAESKTYWTIHLLKLKPGAYAYDCEAVLVPPRQNETVQTSQLLLTTVDCLKLTDQRLGENRIANEKEISVLFIERQSDGGFINHFDIEVERILFAEGYHPKPIDNEPNVMALIKLKEAVQIRETMAPIAISDQLVSNVSRCFAVGRSSARRISMKRRWNLMNREVYIKEAGLNDPITLVDVETQWDGQEIKVDLFESEEKSLLQFTLGSPLICRHNGVDVVQGVVDEVHYDRGSVVSNTLNETRYVGYLGTPVKIGPPNTENVLYEKRLVRSLDGRSQKAADKETPYRLLFTDVYKFSSWMAKTSEEMMQ
uniref:Uncharacterized protein n=1 Tax=Romanomermis culicivorax TaxID=13658 RepID=A0A915K7H4_ROMCU